MLRGTSAGALIQPVQRINVVYSFDADGRRVTYEEGRDWTASGNAIARAAGSRIPDFGTYAYTTGPDGKFDFGSEPRNPPLDITYNVYVDYTSPQADRTVTAQPLPRPTRSVLCLGDSIAQGAHTIEQHYRSNDSQSWCGLLRSFLAPAATVQNEAVPGAALSGVTADLARFLAIPADTVILAFGMNDHVFEPADGVAGFRRDLDAAVQAFRGRGSNVILVGFFQQNELWRLEDPAKTALYNEAIRSVAATRQVPFVDPHSAYESLRTAGDPQFVNLTADFMHHPNVYGQRVYYSLLVPYFLSSNTPASQIPGYVRGSWTR